MRTIDQILEGVTARGKWKREIASNLLWSCPNKLLPIGLINSTVDADFAARAARNFEAMAKALDACATLLEEADKHIGLCTEESAVHANARAVLAEALKD